VAETQPYLAKVLTDLEIIQLTSF